MENGIKDLGTSPGQHSIADPIDRGVGEAELGRSDSVCHLPYGGIGLGEILQVGGWVGELPLPLISCSTQESVPCTLPGHHSRAGGPHGPHWSRCGRAGPEGLKAGGLAPPLLTTARGEVARQC